MSTRDTALEFVRRVNTHDPDSAGYFSTSEKPSMLNFRVRNLNTSLDELRADGVRVEILERIP